MVNVSRIWLISLATLIFIADGVLFFQSHNANQVKASGVGTHPVVAHQILPQMTSNPSPELVEKIKTVQLSGWFYPKSQKVESNAQELQLTSLDDPQAITEWYKDKIVSQGFPDKSFINTANNGNTVNQLVGNDGNRQVAVSIKRQSNSDQTIISVTVSF